MSAFRARLSTRTWIHTGSNQPVLSRADTASHGAPLLERGEIIIASHFVSRGRHTYIIFERDGRMFEAFSPHLEHVG